MKVIALAAAVLAASPSAQSIQAFYSRAIATMDRIAQPPAIDYELHGESGNMHIGLMVVRDQVWLRFQHGSAPTDWRVKHRTQDYENDVLDLGTGTQYASERPLFDPTWFGAFRALRDGMLGYQKADPPRKGLAISAPTPPPDHSLATISSVNVIGPGIYAVQDRGAAPCPNGNPGHALHLVPRHRDPRRQLSDVIVDVQSMRFCMIRFGWTAFWFTGYVEQHYSDVNGYWLQTGGLLDGTLRTFGIARHHFIWRYRLTGYAFPVQTAWKASGRHWRTGPGNEPVRLSQRPDFDYSGSGDCEDLDGHCHGHHGAGTR